MRGCAALGLHAGTRAAAVKQDAPRASLTCCLTCCLRLAAASFLLQAAAEEVKKDLSGALEGFKPFEVRLGGWQLGAGCSSVPTWAGRACPTWAAACAGPVPASLRRLPPHTQRRPAAVLVFSSPAEEAGGRGGRLAAGRRQGQGQGQEGRQEGCAGFSGWLLWRVVGCCRCCLPCH